MAGQAGPLDPASRTLIAAYPGDAFRVEPVVVFAPVIWLVILAVTLKQDTLIAAAAFA